MGSCRESITTSSANLRNIPPWYPLSGYRCNVGSCFSWFFSDQLRCRWEAKSSIVQKWNQGKKVGSRRSRRALKEVSERFWTDPCFFTDRPPLPGDRLKWYFHVFDAVLHSLFNFTCMENEEKTYQKHWVVTLTSFSSQQVQQELLNSLVLLKGQLEVMIAMMMMRMVIGHDQHKMKVNPVQWKSSSMNLEVRTLSQSQWVSLRTW